jgi:hypothetical protein
MGLPDSFIDFHHLQYSITLYTSEGDMQLIHAGTPCKGKSEQVCRLHKDKVGKLVNLVGM